MTNLSLKLKKYYERKGNHVLFAGEYSLNQLALLMWETLGFKGVSASTISRVIQGQRLFTTVQLEAFVSTLKLSNREKDELQYALQVDILNRYKQSNNDREMRTFTLLNEQSKYISIMRERGMLDLTIEWSDILIDQVVSLMNVDNRSYAKLSKILANLYFEKTYAYGCTLPILIYLEKSKLFIERQFAIADELNDIDIFIKAKILKAFKHYSIGIYGQSRDRQIWFEKCRQDIEPVMHLDSKSEEVALMYWRCFGLSSMHLDDKQTFNEARRNTMHILTNTKMQSELGYIVFSMGSIANGQSLFADTKAYETLHIAKELHRQMKWVDPLRECALIRNEIEVHNNLGTHKSKVKLLNKKGAQIANTYGYDRYKKYFQSSL